MCIRDRDIFVATYKLGEDNGTGLLTSACTWSKGIVSMIPETDIVALVALDPRGGQNHNTQVIEWAALVKHAGHLMTPVQGFPTRYRVEHFPSFEAP